jgi:hypothetical protein
MVAVAIGSAPTTTAEWAVVEVCNAKVVRSGKPRTHPAATTASAGQSALLGRGARVVSSADMAMPAARVPRRPVTLQGPKPLSAHSVAGKLSENPRTPNSGDIHDLLIALL